MSEQQLYTPEGFREMKHLLIKAAIHTDLVDRTYEASSDPCFSGDADTGYWLALDHSASIEHQPDLIPPGHRPAMGHYRLPPVGRSRASIEPTVLEDYLGDPVRTLDVWGTPGEFPQGFYARWAEQIDDVFRQWDELPDERDFRALATAPSATTPARWQTWSRLSRAGRASGRTRRP